MEGKTFVDVKKSDNDEEILFFLEDGSHFWMGHNQNCCENVSIEDIVGDLNDLVGTPIIVARESSNNDNPLNGDDNWGSWTWTFYDFRTIKGDVTIRWYGS